MDNIILSTAARALAFGTPLMLGALGAVYAERAGVVNLGMEGMMILGALAGFAITKNSGSPLEGILVAALVGTLAAGIHAFISITLKANQYVSGLALSMFGLGLSSLLGKPFEGAPLFTQLENVTIPGLSSIPGLGVFFTDQSPLSYFALLLGVVLWLVLYRSKLGIIIRSTGENPTAVDALGGNVTLVRYACVMFGGTLAGIAGAFLSVAYRPAWTEGLTNGIGWIALSIAIFAAWNPLGAIGGSLFFGALYSLSFSKLQESISPSLLKMMPFISVLLALSLNALRKNSRSNVPEALGLPYQRGQR